MVDTKISDHFPTPVPLLSMANSVSVCSSIAEVGEAHLSVRTKFMIDTIMDLKNNRMKAGAANSALAAEHTNRMKKTLASLATTRSLRAREPLRISLFDIRDREQKGKWWLVGASFHDPSKLAIASSSASTTASAAPEDDPDAAYDSETPGKPNPHRLARQHGFVHPVRRAIFICLLSGCDYIEAHMKILKLNLKRKQMLEIPRVIVYCVGMEQGYNPFYALVAGKFFRERGFGKSFGYQLWDCLGKCAEEGIEEGEEGEEGERGNVGVKWIWNLGSFFAVLIARKQLGLSALRKLDPGYQYWSEETGNFVEVLLTVLIVQCRREAKAETKGMEAKARAKKVEQIHEKTVREIFGSARFGRAVMGAIKYVLETRVAKAELVEETIVKAVVGQGCRWAVEALEEEEDAGLDDEDEDESDG